MSAQQTLDAIDRFLLLSNLEDHLKQKHNVNPIKTANGILVSDYFGTKEES